MAQRYPKHSRWLIEILNEELDNVPQYGVEIGVWRGHTSEALLETYPDMFLVMVDPYLPYKDLALMSDDRAMLASALIEAKTRTDRFAERRQFLLLPSDTASRIYLPRTFDFVYVDGDHSHEGSKHDIHAWMNLVKPGGILCGDDYKDAPGFRVAKAVDQMFGDRVNVKNDRIWWVKM